MVALPPPAPSKKNVIVQLRLLLLLLLLRLSRLPSSVSFSFLPSFLPPVRPSFLPSSFSAVQADRSVGRRGVLIASIQSAKSTTAPLHTPVASQVTATANSAHW